MSSTPPSPQPSRSSQSPRPQPSPQQPPHMGWSQPAPPRGPVAPAPPMPPVQPAQPMPPVPSAPPFPRAVGEITEATPVPVANEIVRKKAKRAGIAAAVAGGIAVLGAVLTSLSAFTPNGITVFASLSRVLIGPMKVFYFGAVVFEVLSVVAVLRKLRDRAVHFRPQLARSATNIQVMHLWPGMNLFGPVQALAETGVRAAQGPGRLLWPVGVTVWAFGLGVLAVADSTLAIFQGFVISVVASTCLVMVAMLLRGVLSPLESRRLIPPAATGNNQPAFWSKGLIEPTSEPQRRVVDVPIEDSIDQYYRRGSESNPA